jgi:tetratricopeptide (TPR) repeat protein
MPALRLHTADPHTGVRPFSVGRCRALAVLDALSEFSGMDRRELLDQYEATADEEVFAQARAAYESVLASDADARTVLDHGYLLECHARNHMRRAAAQYERAVELDPGLDKARYQFIHAKAALFEPDEAIAAYRGWVAADPGDVAGYRFLAYALLVAHEYRQAAEVIDVGLMLAGADRKLIEFRGDVNAGLGDVDGALADWRRAVELDDSDIGPWYSSAYLLEREGRRDEAIDAWRSILVWNQARGNTMDIDWASDELTRLRGQFTA